MKRHFRKKISENKIYDYGKEIFMGKIIKDTIHAKGIDIGIYTTNFESEFIF